MNENEKQNVKLAEMSKDIKHIKEALDRQIESYNGKFRMTDDRITREVGANKKLIDLHCVRIRGVEKEQAETKTKLSVATTKLAIFISGVIFAGIFLLENFVDYLKHLTK